MKTSIPYIQQYLSVMNYDSEDKYHELLFKNHLGTQMTRQGVDYIIKKYGKLAAELHPELIPDNLSAHKLRHSTAMALLGEDVDLIYIRDLLGHSSVTTTEVYARADAQMKRKAIEAASKEIVPREEAVWDFDLNLKAWLKSFNR